jgi:hypothetical protein
MKKKINDSDNDSDNISDIEENDLNNKDNPVKITDEFKESVIGFIKLDDLIRQRQEDIKELKEKKKPYEEYILKYLDKVGENVIEIQESKLRKNQSETKMPLKIDMIKEAIYETIKKEKKDQSDDKCKELVEETIQLMENKRPLTIRTNLKRTFNRNDNVSSKKNKK